MITIDRLLAIVGEFGRNFDRLHGEWHGARWKVTETDFNALKSMRDDVGTWLVVVSSDSRGFIDSQSGDLCFGYMMGLPISVVDNTEIRIAAYLTNK